MFEETFARELEVNVQAELADIDVSWCSHAVAIEV
jgi:hypothetical protein